MNDSSINDKSVYKSSFVVDSNHNSHIQYWKPYIEINKQMFIMFIIEQDSDIESEHIDSVVRLNYRALMQEYYDGNYTGITSIRKF